jgi:hypothetical protein
MKDVLRPPVIHTHVYIHVYEFEYEQMFMEEVLRPLVIHTHVYIHVQGFECECTAILIIIEGQLQVFQRFSSSKLVLKAVESCFVALNYYENGSI